MSELTLPLRKKPTADQSELGLSGYVSANEEDEDERRSTKELRDIIDVLTAMITQMSVHISDLDKRLVVHELTVQIDEKTSIKEISANLDDNEGLKSSSLKIKRQLFPLRH